jgi:integrase/recombinase XerD
MQTEAFWNGLFDVRWEDAPLGPEAIRLMLRLRSLGYQERTRRDYGLMVVHLGRVLARQGSVDPRRLTDESVEAFVRHHLPRCRCYRRAPHKRYDHGRRALGQLLALLRVEGAIPPVRVVVPRYHSLLERYCHFLVHDRGLAARTVDTYRGFVRDFLAGLLSDVTPAGLSELKPDDLVAFSRRRGSALGTSSWNHLVLSLSSFYRWIGLEGYDTRHLIGILPLRRRYRLADVPCAVNWDQVQQLIAAVDRQALDGLRNYAMMQLMATYGLRGCEVRGLRLDDIDWERKELTIHASKTGHTRQLPLTRVVGEAILAYLRHERPVSLCREVFLSRRPPHGPLRNKFYRWVARCFDRAGLKTPHRGPHTLRHSLAVHLLCRGETLKGIGDLLGHKNIESTFIYTKLQVEDLRQVALGPEVVS